jgi:predicted  nucleic acid-binding Zn-ribbon protein
MTGKGQDETARPTPEARPEPPAASAGETPPGAAAASEPPAAEPPAPAEARSAPSPMPRPADAAPPAGGAASGYLSGGIGGAVAALLLLLLAHLGGFLGDGQDLEPQLTELGQRISAVDQRLAAATTRLEAQDERLAGLEQRPEPEMPTVDLGPLEAAQADLAEQLARLTDGLATATAEREALRTDLAALGPRLDSLAQALREAEAERTVARNSVEQALGELREATSGLGLAVSELRGRLEATGARIEALAGQIPDLKPLTDRIAASETVLDAQTRKLAGLEQQLAALGAAAPDLAPLADRVAALETGLAGQTAELHATAERLEARHAGLADALRAATERLDALQRAAEQRTALAAGLAGLERAVAAGAPLGPALDPLTALGDQDPALAEAITALAPFRAQPVPTPARLQAGLDRLFPPAEEAAPAPGDWLGTARRNLEGLVDIRVAGAADPALESARQAAAAALAEGDVAAAMAALAPLAEAGEPGVADWLAMAQQHLDATAALERLRELRATLTASAP